MRLVERINACFVWMATKLVQLRCPHKYLSEKHEWGFSTISCYSCEKVMKHTKLPDNVRSIRRSS